MKRKFGKWTDDQLSEEIEDSEKLMEELLENEMVGKSITDKLSIEIRKLNAELRKRKRMEGKKGKFTEEKVQERIM